MDIDRFDHLTRRLSTRRGVINHVLAGSLATLLAVDGGGEAPAAKKSCVRGKKLCGKKCIARSKTCCTGPKKACGKKCIPKRLPCCPASKKPCGNTCIPRAACCTTADCPSLKICASGRCVIGQGVCLTGADVCTAGSGDFRCGAAPETASCLCVLTTAGQTRCGDGRVLRPAGDSCLNDEECAAEHPNVPGVFCFRGRPSAGGGSSSCPGERLCMAPCPG